jgi:SAM-dependent methyltransferase
MSEKEIQKRWDELYKGAECVWGLEPDWELRLYLKEIPKGKALDLGIGEGRNAFFLAKEGFEVEGIDLAQEAVRRCNELAQREGLKVRAEVSDVREFPIPEGTYTCIVCAYVLPFLKRSEAEALIGRIKAGLAPGGVAYVAAFSTEDPGYKRCRERGLPEVEPNTFFSKKRRMHLFYVAEGELKNFFNDFELISYAEGYSLDLTHGEPHHHDWASVLAKRLN